LISGKDERRIPTRRAPSGSALPPEALTGQIKGLKIGLPREYMIGGLDPEGEGRRSTPQSRQLQNLGAELVEIPCRISDYAAATYYIIAPAEAVGQPGAF